MNMTNGDENVVSGFFIFYIFYIFFGSFLSYIVLAHFLVRLFGKVCIDTGCQTKAVENYLYVSLQHGTKLQIVHAINLLLPKRAMIGTNLNA